MSEILSLWRSPLDKVALCQTEALRDRQPQCSIGYAEDFSAMTIYNFGYYVTNYAPTAPYDAALTQMFSDMNPNLYTNYGGMAFIPQQSFAVDSNYSANPGPYNVPDQVNIIGSGGGGTSVGSASAFFHFVVTPSSGAATTFLNCSNDITSGGTYFRSLAFQWGNSS